MKSISYGICSAAFALAACATPRPAKTGGPTAGFGQVASIGSLSVAPIQLLEDSRCPVDVQCVWAGTVRLRVSISDGTGGDRPANLTLGAAGEAVTLVAVEPPSRSGQAIPIGDYRFTFARN